MRGWVLLVGMMVLSLLGEARAVGSAVAPVWGMGDATPTFGAGSLERSPDAGLKLSPRSLSPEKGAVNGSGRRHWKNVPKHAWLLLGGCFGLLGIYGFLRFRPRRKNDLNPVIIIGGERQGNVCGGAVRR